MGRASDEAGVAVPPNLTEADGYRTQAALLDLHLAADDTLAGYKIGLTSVGARASYGAATPTWGFLLTSAVLVEPEHPRLPYLRARRIEAEFAFVLARDFPGRQLSANEVIEGTRHLRLAAEIVDTRWRGASSLGALVADDVSNAAVVLGPQVKVTDALFAEVPAVVRADGRESLGTSSAVMGHPAAAVAWLASELGRHGHRLEAGQIVMSGSFGEPLPVEPAEDVYIEFGHLGRLHLKGTTT
ncbi:MAG: hypothetical protein JWM49_2889 [Microbacteriaceae bacterium]|nr:hypothetical protein [Microbacteriaceae bacterium]